MFATSTLLRRAARHDVADWPYLPVLLVLLTGWLMMVWPWLSGTVTIPWDAKAHFLPQVQFLAQSLAAGDSPFWAPYVFSGHPQIADPQAMIFSPPFLALAVMNGSPSLWAMDLTVLLMQLAGAAALMLWFRDRGWHWAGALIAGIAFAFGAAMAWRIQHIGQVLSLSYMPIALVALDRALERHSLGQGIWLGIVSAFMVLGRDQVALLCVYLLAGYALWRLAQADHLSTAIKANVLVLGVAAATCLVLIAAPVLLTAQLTAESNRPAIDFNGAGKGSLHPALLLTLLAPHLFGAGGRMEDYWGPPSFTWQDTGLFIAQNMGQLYVGTVPILLIAFAALRGELWARDIRFFTLALIVSLLYALGWYTPFFRAIFHVLPGVSLFRRPADATFLIGAMIAILAGYAAHRQFATPWIGIERRSWIVVGAVVGVAGVVAVWLGMRLERLERLPLPLGTAALSLAMGALAVCYIRPRIGLQPWHCAFVLVAVTVADLAYNNGPNSSSAISPSVYEVLQPDSRSQVIRLLKRKIAEGDNDTRRDRVELVGLGFHWPNASLTHKLENTLGYNPLRLQLYSRATGAQDTVGLVSQRKFSPLFPSYKSLLANMLGLRFIAAGASLETIDTRLEPHDLELIASTGEAFIYENANTLPRVLFATRAQEADFEHILQTGAWPDFDPKTTLLLERTNGQQKTRREGKVRIVAYRNCEVMLEADSADGGWVVLNDLWHPWWFAQVDGKPAAIARANVLFRAVEVPPGLHTVHFEFQPLFGALAQFLAEQRR
jgi:hypothetical protein